MSSFVQHHTQRLLALARPKSPASAPPTAASLLQTQRLSQIFTQLSSHDITPRAKRDQIAALGELDNTGVSGELERAVYAAAAVSVYEDAMELVLHQALQIEDELSWWTDLSSSNWDMLLYFVSMLPLRISRAIETVYDTIVSQGIPLRQAIRNPRAVQQLLQDRLGPRALRRAVFPRVHSHLSLTASPFALSRSECEVHSTSLEKLRDDRAEQLGVLARLRSSFRPDAPLPFAEGLKAALTLDHPTPGAVSARMGGRPRAMSLAPPTLQSTLRKLALVVLPAHQSSHTDALQPLQRPHAILRAWPRLVLLPPLVWAGFRYSAGIQVGWNDALETIKGFWTGYVVAPIKEILDTVRAGGSEDLRIVSPDALKADMESLQRMAESLARDRLSYTPDQLSQLNQQIAAGDLGPVLRIYEEEMRSPLRSAIGGNLVRALLIQVQKTKVDLDVAMTGIDKLIRSQELTFAFVGVSPAIAIVWGVASWAVRAWRGSNGRGRFGGVKARTRAFLAIRRVERLLLNARNSELSPRTHGLLLLSLHQLRSFGDARLPRGSRLREGFLQDVEDLENTDETVRREDKLAVVQRMWRSWAHVLGWDAITLRG